MAEKSPHKRQVAGSNPAGTTKNGCVLKLVEETGLENREGTAMSRVGSNPTASAKTPG